MWLIPLPASPRRELGMHSHVGCFVSWWFSVFKYPHSSVCVKETELEKCLALGAGRDESCKGLLACGGNDSLGSSPRKAQMSFAHIIQTSIGPQEERLQLWSSSGSFSL